MRPSLKDFKNKALENSDVVEEYNRLSFAYSLRKQLVTMREDAGFTQEEIAVILDTQKSNISRLENANSKGHPSCRPLKNMQKHWDTNSKSTVFHNLNEFFQIFAVHKKIFEHSVLTFYA